MKKIELIAACFILMITVFSCDDKEILLPLDGPGQKIGDTYLGGTVFYINGAGGGLIAAPNDLTTTYTWGGNGITTYATGTSNGTGKGNTQTIATASGVYDGAAYQCYYYSQGVNHDWYLPSSGELTLLFNQKSIIPNITSNYYWSSSEISAAYAYLISFSSGTAYTVSKSGAYYVREIRSF